jgi:hypothetical protein
MSSIYSSEVESVCEKQVVTNALSDSNQSKTLCAICGFKSVRGRFVILSCNHIFHASCVVKNERCNVCKKELEKDELLFAYSKVHTETKEKIANHEKSLVEIEQKMIQIKKELTTCFEYKVKLEHELLDSKNKIRTLSLEH